MYVVKLSPQKCNTSTTAAVRMLAKECVKVLLTCSVVATVILVLTVVKSHPPNHGSELLAVKHYPPLDVDLRTLSQTQVFDSNNVPLSIHMVVVPFLHFDNVSTEKILAREAEYKYVLQKNLDHPLVNRVHILTTNFSETLKKFKDLTNSSKLLIVEVKSANSTRDPFEYISRNLVGRDAMYANADIYLGEGFELVDTGVMRKQKIMYALTRRVKPEDRCGVNRTYTDTDKCLEDDYHSSHDVFLFRLNEPFPNETLEALDFKLPSLGMENVIIWHFQHKLGYCVLNPCSILESFHYHCSDVRSRDLNSVIKVRVNTRKNTGRAPFTTSLNCSDVS